MENPLVFKAKIAGLVLLVALATYGWYEIYFKPRIEVKRLELKLDEKTNLGTTIVNNINKADANRTQKEINNVKKESDFIIHDSGVLFF